MTIQDKKEFLTQLGNRVRQLRTEKQMSLDELARKCGYTSNNARSSIQKIEAGKSDIPASKIRLLAKALETTESFLMGWVDEWDKQFDTEKLSKQIELYELIQVIRKKQGDTAGKAMEMYFKLDSEDQAEIRGEMRGMLKHEKYSTQEGSLSVSAM